MGNNFQLIMEDEKFSEEHLHSKEISQ